MIYFNGILDIIIIVLGINVFAKYVVLYFVKGLIKFKMIKIGDSTITVREYKLTKKL